MEIKIRKAEVRDFLDVQELHSMPQVYSGTLQLPLPNEEMWKKRISECPANLHFYVAEVDGKVVAFSGLNLEQNNRRRHVASIGIAVHDDWVNRRIGSALLANIIDVADNWLAIIRIELTVFHDNLAAIKLYEKAGFEKEGIHKKYAFRNGEFQDVIAMARIK